MATTAFPVVIWQDAQGDFTASALDWLLVGESLTSFDQTRSGALRQIKDFLTWQIKVEDEYFTSDFQRPQLDCFTLELRPEYRSPDGRRRYPCEYLVPLRLPCVHGRTAGGVLCGTLPTLGMGFYYHDPSALRHMAIEHARQLLTGSSPKQLSRYLPPSELVIDQVLVRTRIKRRGGGPRHPALPHLRQIAEPMGTPQFRKAYSGAFQREAEVLALAERLKARSGSLLLVGEPGVGKTTLLVAAIRSLERKQEAEEELPAHRHRHWCTNASRLIAGMKYLGEWQERAEQVIDELSQIDGTLCFPSVIELLQKGGSGPGDSIAAFLLPYLQHRELRVIAETSPGELEACRRLLPGFAQSFDILRVEPLDPARARSALARVAEVAAGEARIDVDDRVIPTVQRLHQRFLPYHPLPGRAVNFLRRLMEIVIQHQERQLTTADVVHRFIHETGLPEFLLDDARPLSRTDVLQKLQQQVIGQPRACSAAAQLVTKLKAGLNDPLRPIGTLLFCGPTGVGKTQLARSVADYLFGAGDAPDRLVRLDMSEYAAPWAAERLLTRPDGVPSDLINRVRAQPFCVLLLDEIEKAAAEVFDLLLGLLDEGRLTDRFGRTTWFRAAVIVLTSNLGTTNRQSIGFGEGLDNVYEREVRSFFRPEFFNRLDGVVTFRPLGREVCAAITRKELGELVDRSGLDKRRIRLHFSEAVVERVVERGFDARFGARPLQRAIQDLVVTPISRLLIGDLQRADTTIHLDVSGDSVTARFAR